jgi:hypothetical protein
MTDTAIAQAQAPGGDSAHPLDPVSAAEYLAGRQILTAAGLLAQTVRFAYSCFLFLHSSCSLSILSGSWCSPSFLSSSHAYTACSRRQFGTASEQYGSLSPQ